MTPYIFYFIAKKKLKYYAPAPNLSQDLMQSSFIFFPFPLLFIASSPFLPSLDCVCPRQARQPRKTRKKNVLANIYIYIILHTRSQTSSSLTGPRNATASIKGARMRMATSRSKRRRHEPLGGLMLARNGKKKHEASILEKLPCNGLIICSTTRGVHTIQLERILLLNQTTAGRYPLFSFTFLRFLHFRKGSDTRQHSADWKSLLPCPFHVYAIRRGALFALNT